MRNDFEATNGQDAGQEIDNDLGTDAAPATVTVQPDAIRVQPGPDGIVNLPAGVNAGDIVRVGPDLVVPLPDGGQMVIVDGAVFVPQLNIGDATIPPTTVAALLIQADPPAGPGDDGNPNNDSSGGNFAAPVGGLGPDQPLGDLLPPTERFRPLEQQEDPGYFIDEEEEAPSLVIESEFNRPGVPNATADVEEEALPARGDEPEGSNEPSLGEITSGTIIFTPSDSSVVVDTITVDGVEITNVGQQIEGEFGTLIITSIAPGRIGFDYVLGDNTIGADQEVFTVTVTTPDGQSATGTLTIDIIDDAPTAVDDGPVAVPEDSDVVIDAFGNDIQGADGVALDDISLTTGPSNGTAVYNGDGTFTYTPNQGFEGEDSFTYTIVDGDGSASTATVTVVVDPDSEPEIAIAEGSDVVVNEAGLDNGGSDAASDSEIADGALTFDTGNDGVGSLVIGGVDVTNGGTVQGQYGTLTVTGNPTDGYTYSYELTTNLDDLDGAETDDFDVVLTDTDGDTADTELSIEIVDDVPTANDDSAAQAAEDADITVDVFANDVAGADGVDLVTGVELVAGSLSGAGTLTYNDDGTFTYDPAPGEEGTVTFDYKITDGDGDMSTATVTIELLPDSTPDIAVVDGSDTVVNEAGLDNGGSDAASNSEVGTGALTFDTGNDTVGSLVINGVDVTNGGQVTTALGVLTITGNPTDGYEYSYELTTNLDDVDGVPETDDFNVVLTDSDGDMADTVLSIEIVDDLPVADDDSATQAAEDADITVDVFANDVAGADGVDLVTGVALVPGTLSGPGTLTYNDDGTFTYDPVPGEEGVVTFQYEITDGDGDPSIATVTITLLPDSTPDVVIADGSDTVVDEAALDGPPNGADEGSDAASNDEVAAGTIDFDTGNDTVASLVIEGVDVTNGGQVTTALGVLTVTGNPTDGYSYSYELTTNLDDVDGVPETDDFNVVLTDSDGDVADTVLSIEILDDVPTANDDGSLVDPIIVSEDNPEDIDVFANDVAGADGVDLVTGVTLVTGPTKGTVVYNDDGTFTYTPTAGLVGPDSFVYQIVDADGDVSTATVYLDLADDSKPQIGQPQTVTVDEDGLGGANADDGQTDPLEIDGSGQTTSTGSVDVDFGADVPADEAGALAQIVLLDDPALDGQLTYNGQPVTFALVGGQLVGSADGDDVIVIAIKGATINGDTVTYEYSVTLLEELDHTNGDDSEASISLVGIGFEVSDTDTAFTAQSSFDAIIFDDVPEVTGSDVDDNSATSQTSDADITDVDSALSLADLFDYSALFGADGPAAADSIVETYGLDLLGDVDLGDATVGVDSGLTSGGAIVYLYDVNGDIVASTAAVRGDVDAGNTVFSLSVDASTGVITQTQTGVLDHTDDGSATDDVLALANGLVNGTYEVTATDGDGDSATSTATTDLGGNILFGDDAPSAEDGNVTVAVDEDELPGGNTDNDGVDTTSSGMLNALVDFGNDLPGSFSFDLAGFVDPNLTSGGETVNWAIVGGVLVGYTGMDATDAAARVIEISLTESNGNWSLDVELLQQIDHLPNDPANDDGQILSFDLGGAIVATDFDGDDITLSNDAVTIDVEDDIPTISASNDDDNSVVAVTSDAEITDGDSSQSVADLFSFTANYGADGQGAAPVEAYGLDVVGDVDLGDATVGVDSGLTSGGDTVYLYQITDGTIVGSTATTKGDVDGANTTFIVTVNPTTGQLLLQQNQVLDHTDDGSSTDDQLVLDNGLLNATYSVTIEDGDTDTATATQTADLGGNIAFDDDAPSAEDGNVTVQVDEDELPGGNSDGDGVDTTESGMLNALVDFGNDLPGSFAFDLTNFVDPNITSGGDAVKWGIDGGVLVGYTGATIDDGRVIEISLSESNGNWSLDVELLDQVDHLPNNPANDDGQLLDFDLGAAIVATDFDGDDITLANDAITISVEDDIPTVSASNDDDNSLDSLTSDADITDSDNGLDLDALFSFTANYGADGQGGVPVEDYGLDLVGDDEGNAARAGIDSGLTSGGATVYLYEEGGVIIASTAATFDLVDAGNTVFDLALNGSLVEQTQYKVLDHTDDGSSTDDVLVLGNGLVNATYSVTIEDGDTDTASSSATADLGGNIKFGDDAPSAVAGTVTVQVDEDELPGGNTDNDGVDTTESGLLNGLVDFGNDLPGTFSFDISGFTDPNLTSNGLTVNWGVDGSGVLVGYTGADIDDAAARVIEISLTESNGDWSVNVELLKEVDHLPNDPANDDGQTLDFDIGGAIVATDFDGDDLPLADAAVNIVIEDDIPTVSASNLDDDTLTSSTSDADITDSDSAIDLANLFDFTANFGADGPAVVSTTETYGLDLVGDDEGNAARAGIDSGLTSGGATVYLYEDGGDIIASTAATFDAVDAGNTVFGLLLNGTTLVQSQFKVLDHTDNGSSTDDLLVLANGLVNATYEVVITDGDTDVASSSTTADLGGNITFADDAPLAQDDDVVLSVDEDELPGGITDGDGDNTTDSGSLAGLFDTGNDLPGTYSFDLTNFVDPNWTSGGNTIEWTTANNGATLIGYVGDPVTGAVITVAITDTAAGTVEVEIEAPIDHLPNNPANDDNQTLTLDLSGAVTFTDFDGDEAAVSAGSTVEIVIEDDIPTVSASNIDNDMNVFAETSDADITDSDSSQSVADLFSYSANYGADGQGAVDVESYGLDVVGDVDLGDATVGVDSGLTSGGSIVYLYQIAPGVVVGSTATTKGDVDGSNTTFLVSVNANTGQLLLEQTGVIDHTDDGSSTDTQQVLGNGLLNATYSVTIEDGDTDVANATQVADLGGNIAFNDDVPTELQDIVGVRVEEDELPGGATDGDAFTTVATGALGVLVDFGNDLPASFGFDLTNFTDPGLTSNGATVKWGVDGDTLVGYTGATIDDGRVLEVELTNTTTGAFEVRLLDQVDHLPNNPANDDGQTLTLEIGDAIVATDFDGDSITLGNLSAFQIVIEDDIPVSISPDAAISLDGDQAGVIENLNVVPGADQPGSTVFNIVDGAMATDTDGNLIGLDGVQLYLFGDGTGQITATTDPTGVAGDVGFTVTINGDGTYTFDVEGNLTNGTETTFDDLSGTQAGNVQYVGIGANDPATLIDAVLSGGSGTSRTSVNTDSDSIGVANQSFDNGETLRIDFVTDLVTAGTTSGFDYGTHVATTSFEQFMPQVQGNQSQTVAIRVTPIEVTGDGLPDTFDRTPSNGISDGTPVVVTTVTVTENTGEVSFIDISAFAVGSTFVINDDIANGQDRPIVGVKNADGSVTIIGLQQGDTYGISTSADFEAILVTALPTGTSATAGSVTATSSQDSFDLGIFSVGSDFAGFDIVQEFDVTYTDADGDSVTGTIQTVVDQDGSGAPYGNTSTSVSLASVAQEPLLSSNDNQLQTQQSGTNFSLAMGGAMIAGMSTDLAMMGSFDTGFSPMLDAFTPVFDQPLSASFQQVTPVTDGAEFGLPGIDGGFGIAADPVFDGGFGGAVLPQAGSLDTIQPMLEPDFAPLANDMSPVAVNDAGLSVFAANDMIAMPGAEAMAVLAANEAVIGDDLGNVLSDALMGGDMDHVDDMLANLGDGGLFGDGGLAALAPLGDFASFNMGFEGGFTFATQDIMVMEAMVLHHDAMMSA